MKKVLGFLAVLCISASVAGASDFKLYGSYWNTSDIKDTFGGGLGFTVPLGSSPLAISLAGTYYRELSDEPVSNLFDPNEGFFQKKSLEVLPVDLGLQYNFPSNGPVSAWIEGGGTYFFIDSTRKGVDVDNETGWHASVGSRFGNRQGANFFVEGIYRSTEATVTRNRGVNVELQDKVKIDLDGFGANAGIVWHW